MDGDERLDGFQLADDPDELLTSGLTPRGVPAATTKNGGKFKFSDLGDMTTRT